MVSDQRLRLSAQADKTPRIALLTSYERPVGASALYSLPRLHIQPRTIIADQKMNPIIARFQCLLVVHDP